ncbi:rod shape-determining protein MreD [Brassicibacter mesophilus]|uniref:rod shape-determining protein MreD n=1 Tax=Brassicibacter mesophilus TaxID=745119 RepID=UPI003D1D53A3
MRYFIIVVTVILNFLFQSTIFQYFGILGVVPNTSLILIISFALLSGKRTGATLGIFIGLLQDIFFCDVIGVNTLIYFIIGYLVGLTDQKVFKENIFLPFVFTGLSTVFYHIMYFFFMYFLSINVQFMKLMNNIVFVEIIYNSIISVFIYKQILKIYAEPRMSFRKRARR